MPFENIIYGKTPPQNEFDRKTINVSRGSLPDATRYPVVSVDPTISNEDLYAANQGALDKWKNGAVKFGALTGTTFLEGTVGLVNGAIEAVRAGDFSKFYDNSYNRSLNEFNEGLENRFANYMSQSEKDAAWYSPDTWATANFWSDTIFKNAGFALGAYLSGGAWSKVFSAVGKAASVVGKGGAQGIQDLQEMNAVEQAVTNRSAQQVLANTSTKLNELSDAFAVRQGIKTGLQKYGDNLLRSVTAAAGESQIEASHAIQAYKDKLVDEYTQLHGFAPTGDDLKEIETTSSKVGNTVFGANMVLLTGTNLWQFPKIMGKAWNAEKRVVTDAERNLGRMVVKDAEGNIIQREGLHTPLGTIGNKNVVADLAAGETYGVSRNLTWIGDQLERTWVGRRLNRVAPIARLAYSPSESFEEAAQSYIPLTTEAYFDKGSDTEGDFFGSIRKGISETLLDMKNKDFWVSALSGGISGGLMEVSMGRASSLRERREAIANAQSLSSSLNDVSFAPTLNAQRDVTNQLKNEQLGSHMQELSRSLNRSQKLDQEAYTALQNNDRLTYEDVKMDKYLNYLLPRIQYGRKDLVNADIQGWKENASTQEGWQQMIKDGVVNEDMTQADFIKNMNTLQSLSDSVDSHFEYLNARYGDVRNNNGELRYSPNIMMQMAYTYAKIGDYNDRINQLNTELTEKNVNVTPFLSMVNTDFSENVTEQTQNVAEEVLSQIQNNSNLTGEEKEDLFVKVGDMLELFARRKFKVDEYEEIRKNPEAFDRTAKQDAEDNQEEVVSEVPPRTENAKENFYNANKGNKFQLNLGRRGVKEGNLVYSEKNNVLALKDEDGNLYEITNEDFRNGLVTGAKENDITYNPFLEEQDERVEVKRQNTIRQISKFMDEGKKRIDDISERIKKTQQELTDLNEKIASNKFYMDEDRKFLIWASDHSEALEVLGNARIQTEQTLQDLVDEREQLQEQMGVYQEILDAKPVDFQFVLNDVEAQLDLTQNLIQDLIKEENHVLETIGDIGKAIDYLANVIKSRLNLKLAKNPNQVDLITVNNLVDRLTGNPSLQAYEALRDKLAELGNLDVAPTEAQRDRLVSMLNDIQKEYNNTVNNFENRQVVYDQLTQNAFNIENPLDPADFIKQEEAAEILVEETSAEEGDMIPPNPKEYVGAKKLLKNYFRSTKVMPDELKQAWYTRYTQATNNFMTLPRQVRDKMRVMFVTPSNEEVLGVKGFTDTFFLNKFGTPFYKNQDRFSVINGAIGAVVVLEENDGLYFVDQFGNKTNKVGVATDPNTIIGSKMSEASLVWQNQQEGFVQDELNAEEELKRYTEERARILQDTSATPQTYKFLFSRGKQSSYKAGAIVENIVSKEDVDKPGLIKIAKTGQSITTNDGVAFITKSRFAYLQTDDIYAPLNVRKVGDYAKSIVAALKVYSRREGENNSEKLVNFLKNVLPFRTKIISQNEIDVDGTVYNIQDTEDGKLVSLLENKNHQVHDMLQEPFTEFYLDREGNLQQRDWNTYQSFLISNQYNDGNRLSEPILTSDASKDQRNKYMLLQGFMGRTTSPSSVTEEVQAEVPFEEQEPIPEAQRQYDAQIERREFAKKHAEAVRNKLREVFRPKLSGKFTEKEKDEQIEAAIALIEQRAKTWGKETGRDKDEYYQRLQDVRQSNVGDLSESALFQIIGEEGAANLLNSEIVLKNLKAAKMFRNENVPERMIKRMTGWEYDDVQKAWKTETDDIFTFDVSTVEDKVNTTLTLPEFISNADELFSAYPNLKNVTISFVEDPTDDYLGEIHFENKHIKLNLPILKKKRGNYEDNIKETLIHEIQHFIQVEEGWEVGANESMMRDLGYTNTLESYERTQGEAEARNAEVRSRLSLDERFDTLLSDTEDVAPEDKIYINSLTKIAKSITPTLNFQEDNEIFRAAVESLENGDKILHALKEPNISTLAHEFAHIFSEDLTDEEVEIVEDWAGAKRGTVEYEEAFARGFEKYMSEENPELSLINQIFAKFASWLKELYDTVINSPIDIEMSDDIRKVYDRLLGVQRKYDDRMETVRNVVSEMSDADRKTLVSKLFDLYQRKTNKSFPRLFKQNLVTSYPIGTKVILQSGKMIIVGNTEGLTKSEKTGLKDGTLAGSALQGVAQAYQAFKEEKIIKSLGVEKSIAPKNLPEIYPSC